MNPIISIIVPIYNKDKYLDNCLKSISKQTILQYELILVNDGSTDGSPAICERYSELDDRIILINTEHMGVSHARNIGLKKKKGEYICFIDADDIVSEEYLHVLYDSRKKYDCVCCNINITASEKSEDQRKITIRKKQYSIISKEEAMKYVLTLSDKEIFGSQCGKLFKNEIIKEYGVRFDEKSTYCEDILFVITYLNYCKTRIKWIDENIYYYINRTDGLSKSRYMGNNETAEGKLTEFETLKKCNKYIKKHRQLRKPFKTRIIKSAVATIREYEITGNKKSRKYKKLLSVIRKNSIGCMISPTVSVKNKLSIILCSISPYLETMIWKKETIERK